MRAVVLALTKKGDGYQLRGQLWDQLGDQLGGQLGDQLGGQLGDQLGDQLYQVVWMIGGWDGFWLAFYEAGRSVGATYPELLNTHFEAYSRYAKTCGVAFCYRDIAFVSDRPTRMRFDEARRLHCEDGAALEWADGYGVYAWHGYSRPRKERGCLPKWHREKLDRDIARRHGLAIFDAPLAEDVAELI